MCGCIRDRFLKTCATVTQLKNIIAEEKSWSWANHPGGIGKVEALVKAAEAKIDDEGLRMFLVSEMRDLKAKLDQPTLEKKSSEFMAMDLVVGEIEGAVSSLHRMNKAQ